MRAVLIVDGGNYTKAEERANASLACCGSPKSFARNWTSNYRSRFCRKVPISRDRQRKYHIALNKPMPDGPGYKVKMFFKKMQNGLDKDKGPVSISVEEGVDVAIATKIIECA